MLDTAQAFERTIKNPKGLGGGGESPQVTWDNPKELESFISQLESITDRLTTENRRLRKCHTTLIDKVRKYYFTSLIVCLSSLPLSPPPLPPSSSSFPSSSSLSLPLPLIQTVALMSTDLLRQQAKWKETLMEARQMMASLVQEGFNSSNMRPWKLHWDHQLYKALEHQYQLGLEGLNEHLPEIKVELTYRLAICTCIV